MIEIYENTKVYIATPAGVKTAGPELLHQMVFHLRNYLGIESYIYFIPPSHPFPIPTDFNKYNNPFVRKIEDEADNVIIVPEIYSALQMLGNFSKIRKVIWWLSIDNFFISRFVKRDKIISLPIRVVNKITELLCDSPLVELDMSARKYYTSYKLFDDLFVKQAKINLCSAKHVKFFLEGNGLKNVFYISEFLNEDFLKTEFNLGHKENIVVYNPLKGKKFTQKIIKAAKHIKFVPIQNLTREGVINLLKRAKVYIDFGNHPGRDRLPREAAILGCCIITNRRGGARLAEDLAILDEYKFDDIKKNIPEIVNKIENCLSDYATRIFDFDNYRIKIRVEPEKYKETLPEIFLKTNKFTQ